jgi:hypothetical protein
MVSSRQVSNLAAMPVLGLMEMNVRQRRRNEVLVVVSPSYRTGHKRQNGFTLANRLEIPRP